MFFTRIVAIAALAFGILTAAAPMKTDTGTPQVEKVLNDLKSKTDIIIPQIKQLTLAGQGNKEQIGILVTQLTNDLIFALTPLSAITVNQTLSAIRETSKIIGAIINGTVQALVPLGDASKDSIILDSSLLAQLNSAFTDILIVSARLVGDIFIPVAGLLGDNSQFLESLGLGGVSRLLGLE